jgi:hypothetical protein
MEKVLSGSVTFDIRDNNVSRLLLDACIECSDDNWDGYGAKAIQLGACLNAAKFLKMMPTTFPIPEIDVEPNGGVMFEWCNNARKVFSAIIEGDDRITYAGLFGENKTYGTEYFGNELPKPILENVQRLFS